MPDIYFKEQDQHVQAAEGTTILQAARDAGIIVESPCDGVGTCGKCKVQVEGPEGSFLSEEAHFQMPPELTAQGGVLRHGDALVIHKNTGRGLVQTLAESFHDGLFLAEYLCVRQ